MTITRRGFLAASTYLSFAASRTFAAGTAASEPFSRDILIEKARVLATRAYEQKPQVPEAWRNISYQDYQTRWFRTADALWSKTDRSYNVDFFLPGLYFKRPVGISVVENGQAKPFRFDLSLFDKTDKAPDLPVDDTLGYSGFRLRTELGQPGIKNEFCVFQGASYFRAIGQGQTYGLSARGLAIDTGERTGEEFPDFTDFWIEAPQPGQKVIIVHALLDSPSATGAYRFEITPGAQCVMEIEASLFPRGEVQHIGIAPLTSMFLYDATNRTRFDDFRPAVHDSNGLMVWNGAGEVLWRPLANPKTLQTSSFVDVNPRGFGLMQRSRNYSDFSDLEAHYHNRPGVWIEPRGNWGKGAVTLVEIPSDKEIYDNIVAYWRPSGTMESGERHDLAYRLTWCAQAPVNTHLPKVIGTAMGLNFKRDKRLAVIDFAPDPRFAMNMEGITKQIRSPHVETSEGVLEKNPETGGLRLAFSFDPGDRDHVELRAQLLRDGTPASEVWLYRWTP